MAPTSALVAEIWPPQSNCDGGGPCHVDAYSVDALLSASVWIEFAWRPCQCRVYDMPTRST
jgi:hypothetical protein